MAAITVQRAMRNTTDAEFRAWGKAISDQLAAGGWVKTADTGQIDWATVAFPAVTNTAQGYEIWRSNDAAGSLVEFYLKIEYGSGDISASNVAIWLTLGWASNGTGSLSGIVSTRTRFANSSNSNTLVNCNLAAGAGWAAMVLGTTNQQAQYFAIERTRNNAQAQQNEIVLVANSPSSGLTSQVITQTKAFPIETGGNPFAAPNIANSIQDGQVGLGLMFGTRGRLTNPLTSIFGCKEGALGGYQNTVSITSYGAARTYIINQPANGAVYFGSSVTYQLLTRFD